jgi:hypothetical protein
MGSCTTPPARPAQSFHGASHPIAPDEPIQGCSTYPKLPGNTRDCRAIKALRIPIDQVANDCLTPSGLGPVWSVFAPYLRHRRPNVSATCERDILNLTATHHANSHSKQQRDRRRSTGSANSWIASEPKPSLSRCSALPNRRRSSSTVPIVEVHDRCVPFSRRGRTIV